MKVRKFFFNIILLLFSICVVLVPLELVLKHREGIEVLQHTDFSFTELKGPENFVIAVGGGSTSMGEPYHKFKISSVHILAQYLRKKLPSTTVEVDVYSRDGADLDSAFQSLLQHMKRKPDLLVMISGHNEFLGKYGPNQYCKHDGLDTIGSRWLKRTATGRFFRRRFMRTRFAERPETKNRRLFDRPIICPETWNDTLLQYKTTLRDIASFARVHGIPVLFGFPAGNLRDYDPNRSVYRGNLEEKQIFEQLYRWGRHHLLVFDVDAALACFDAAEQIDAGFADLLFRKGQALWAKQQIDQSRRYFQAASDSDGFPFRALDDLAEPMAEVSKNFGAIFIDFRSVFQDSQVTAILDSSLFSDMHHPNLTGYFLMAKGMYKALAKSGVIPEIEGDNRNSFSLPSDEEVLRELHFGQNNLWDIISSRIEWLRRIRLYANSSIDRLILLEAYVRALDELPKSAVDRRQFDFHGIRGEIETSLRDLLDEWMWPVTSPHDQLILEERRCRVAANSGQEALLHTFLSQDTVIRSLNPWWRGVYEDPGP